MDEQALNELLECSVCLEQLDSSSKVLPCQHTFCRRCLDEIVCAKSELRCPECRTLVDIAVDNLPPNILLVRLLEGLKTQCRLSAVQQTTVHAGIGQTADPGAEKPHQSSTTHHSLKKINVSRPCAQALYNYDALDPSDLSFKKDELIYLRRQVDDNWFHGEIHGKHGFFPASYVQVITPLPDSSPKCKALYDFQIDNKDSGKDCVFFKKDDILTVLRRVDENWAEGKLGEKIGIFPIAFVELNHAAKELLSKSVHKSTPPPTQPSSRRPPAPSPQHASSSRQLTSSPVAAISRHQSNSPSSSPHSSLHRRTESPRSGSSSPAGLSPCPSTAVTQQHTSSSAVHSNPDTPTSTPPSAPRHQSMAVPTPALATVMSSTPQVQITSATSVPKAVSQNSQIIVTGNRSLATNVTASNNQNLGPPPSEPPPPPPPIYVAIYNYKPQKEDEISLVKGEHYTVSEKCQDGWFKGISLKTGKLGVFPGNYVQLVKHKTGPPVHSPARSPQSSSNAQELPSLDYQVRVSESSSQSLQPPALPPKTANLVDLSPSSQPPPTPARNHDDPVHVMCQVSTRRNSAPAERNSGVITVALPPQRKYNKPLPAAPSTPVHSSTDTSFIVSPPPPPPMAACKDSKSKDKKDREKGGIIKYLKQHGRSKASTKHAPSVSEIGDVSISHGRSSSLTGIDSTGGILTVPAPPSVKHHGGSLQKKALVEMSSAAKPVRPKPLMRERYRCVVAYPSTSDIELELKVGDVIYVHKKRDDGWFKGTLARTGKTGLFPRTFVELF
ncbi:E3 ubiquitin-protein ligase SH3RF3-like [Tubulanus polymorphus]|uniref:E3 ubiquitin-protein ligase SH3RF3-like n=1 Tax=Tubulanus polymorphus TaxID=672921 RepID=UPI003DA4C12E